MSKPNPVLHAAFERANKAGDLPAAVQLARQTLAKELFTGAVDDDAGTLINLLRGERERRAIQGAIPGDAWVEHCADVFAALAMGVALGQLVHPDVFKTGGAR
jgi:hypothetical protein